MKLKHQLLLDAAVRIGLKQVNELYTTDGGLLSVQDEFRYFRAAEVKLWTYVDAAQAKANGVSSLLPISQIARDVGVSEQFVTTLLKERGFFIDEFGDED